MTVALILPVNAGGITARAAVGFYEECQSVQNASEKGNGKDAKFLLYATDGKKQAVVETYRTAAQNGADVIIGPLLRENVAALIEKIPDAPVPTLLLQPGAGGNYYFLTAEAGREAAELAELIIAAKATEVVIVLQKSDLASRQMNAFSVRWLQISGKIPDIFRPDDAGWTALFERHRDAAEDGRRIAVFAAGDAAFARRTRNFTPSYHPVFAGSFSYDGAAFADNIYMMVMPQLLTPPADGDSEVVRRFRALGNDVCHLALRVDLWAGGFVYDGKSGDILLKLNGKEFRRRGVLARQRGGRLQKAPPLSRLFAQ